MPHVPTASAHSIAPVTAGTKGMESFASILTNARLRKFDDIIFTIPNLRITLKVLEPKLFKVND